jgi:PKD repeat protein
MEVKPMSFKKFLPFSVAAVLVAIMTIPGCDELITESYRTTLVDTTLGTHCTQCHDDTKYFRPTSQWENSDHASAELFEAWVDLNGTDESPGQCGPVCHTNEGFVEWVEDGTSSSHAGANVIVCFTCHSPHSGPFGSWDDNTLRGLGNDSLPNVTFLAGDIVYNAGKSNMCAICHKATDRAPQTSGDQDIDHLWGPHFSPQADAFRGTSGYLTDESVDLTNPHKAVQDGCIGCHYGTGKGYELGEHTFRLRNDETGEEFLTNCAGAGCHAGGKSLNSLHDFYTGEHDSLMIYGDSLEVLLKTWGLLDADDPTGRSFTPADNIDGELAQILYNYLFYRMDGSKGVHNPPYLNELVSTSLEVFKTMAPRALFSVSDTVICYGDSIYFYDNSSSMVGITDRCWTYDPLLESCEDAVTNPVHVFTDPGTYYIGLRVTDGNGQDSVIYHTPIRVKGPQAAIGIDSVAGEYNDAVIDTVVGFAPLDVFFSDASECTGPETTWEWIFTDHDTVIDGDDTVISEYDTITTQDAGSYIFSTVGFDSVMLTLRDPIDELVLYTATKYVSARGPQAAFSANYTFGFSPHEVQFTDQSTAGSAITDWKWDFGDTATEAGTSVLQHPSYAYTYPGEYDVTLTVTSALGSDALTKVDMIRVFKPSAIFSWVNDSGCTPLTVSFYNESIDLGNVDTVVWYFGDDERLIQTADFGQVVTHEYLTSDSFDVTLQLRGSWGLTDDTKYNLVQAMGPEPGFSYDTTIEYCTNQEISFFSDTGGCNVDTHQWIFGIDTASTVADPIYAFADTGSFWVWHNVASDSSDYGERSDSLRIEIIGPSAKFWILDSIAEGCRPMTVTFVNESLCPVDEWHWYLGGNSEDTAIVTTTNTVTHTYETAARYQPTLQVLVDGQVIDSAACDSTIIHVKAVTAGFEVDTRRICQGDSVAFTDTSSCGAATYSWTFGDTTESQEANPVHVYDSAGTFEVTLTVRDGDGNYSSNSPKDTITVFERLEKPTFDVTAPPAGSTEIEVTGKSTNADTWAWLLFDANNNKVAQADTKDATLDPLASGTYTIVLIVTNPCGEKSSDPVEVIVP